MGKHEIHISNLRKIHLSESYWLNSSQSKWKQLKTSIKPPKLCTTTVWCIQSLLSCGSTGETQGNNHKPLRFCSTKEVPTSSRCFTELYEYYRSHLGKLYCREFKGVGCESRNLTLPETPSLPGTVCLLEIWRLFYSAQVLLLRFPVWYLSLQQLRMEKVFLGSWVQRKHCSKVTKITWRMDYHLQQHA